MNKKIRSLWNCLFALVLLVSTVHAAGPADAYSVYKGDLNADGFNDIYLYVPPKVVLLSKPIATPIVLQEGFRSYVLYGLGNGYYAEPVIAAVPFPLDVLQLQDVTTGLFIDEQGEIFIRATNADDANVIVSGLASYQAVIGYQFELLAGLDISRSSGQSLVVADLNGDGYVDFRRGNRGFYDSIVFNEAGSFNTITDTTPVYEEENYVPPADIPAESVLVGTTANSGVTVSRNGAAEYAVPIQVPPGVKGLQPNLAFSYNSLSGNGLLGLGWNISGLSAISRCRSTIAQDGFMDAVDFDANDRFCLDGQRLVVANVGIYGATNTQYRTEIDTYSRVTSLNSSSRVFGGSTVYEPGYFKVEQKSGLILEYGATVNSKIEAQGKTIAHLWLLNKVSDRNGNFYTLTYQEDNANGDYRISKIEYGFHATQNLSSPLASVEFDYGTVNRPDSQARYFAGSVQRVMKLLRSVTTYTKVDSTLTKVRSYNLSYQSSGVGAVSRLQFIQECDGQYPQVTSCLPAIRFQWELGQMGYDSTTTTSFQTRMTLSQGLGNPGSSDSTRIKFADFNGDGLEDIYYMPASGSATNDKIYLSDRKTGNRIEFTTPYLIDNRGYCWTPRDESGTPDSHYGCFPNSGLERIQFGDFDGNGLTDIFRIRSYNQAIPDEIIYSFYNSSTGYYTQSFLTSFTTGGVANEWGHWSAGEGPDIRRYKLGDFNGDGLTDVMYLDGYRSPAPARVYLAISGSGNLGKFTAVTNSGLTTTYNYFNREPYDVVDTAFQTSRYRQGDFNGDGLVDIYYFRGWGNTTNLNTSSYVANGTEDAIFFSNGNGTFTQASNVNFRKRVRVGVLSDITGSYLDTATTQFGDFNGDGKTDILAFGVEGQNTHTILFSKGDGSFNAITISGLTFAVPTNTSDALKEVRRFSIVDLNGDGFADLYRAMSGTASTNYSAPDEYYLSNGDGSFTFGLTTYSTIVRNDNTENANFDLARFKFVDMNADGIKELYYINGSPTESLASDTIYLMKGIGRTKAKEFTDSLGIKTNLEYISLPNLSLDLWADTQNFSWLVHYPYRVSVPTMDVVRRVTSNDGDGGTLAKRYAYRGFVTDLTGRGSVGFYDTSEIDETDELVKSSSFLYAFPYSGALILSNTYIGLGTCSAEGDCPGGTLVSSLDNSWSQLDPLASVRKVYLAGTTKKQRFLNDNYQLVTGAGSSEIRSSTTFGIPDQYGNQNTITESVTDEEGGISYSVVTRKVPNVDEPNWLLNKLSSITTESNRGRSGSNITNTANLSFDATTGQLLSKITEPTASDDTTRLITRYIYDGYGNPVREINCQGSVSLSACVETLVSARIKRFGYDGSGRFLTSTTLLRDPVGGVERTLRNEFTTDGRFGVVVRTIDENLNETNVVLDSLGRPDETVFPDGTKTIVSRDWCNANTHCPEVDDKKGYFKVSSISSGQAPTSQYFDQFGRQYRGESIGFDGQFIFTDTQYDNRGRADKVSEPYFEGANNIAWHEYSFDILNRVQEHQYTDAEGNPQTETYDYMSATSLLADGFTESVTDALGHQTTKVKNVLGQLVKSVDADGKVVEYVYDRLGNLATTKVNNNNATLVTMGYDNAGRKISLQDPDLGAWAYQYNSFGDMVTMTSRRSLKNASVADIVTRMYYDRVGRLISRTEGGDSSTWVYDNAPGKGVGLLASMSHTESALINSSTFTSAHSKSFSYDAFSRLTRTSYSTDNAAYTGALSQTFDDFGRVLSITYPTGVNVRRDYNEHGYLAAVNRTDVSQSIWTAQQMNARGQLEAAHFGNGVMDLKAYSEYNGALKGSEVVSATGQDIHRLTYTYNAIGNVHTRSDDLQALTETFGYDAQNRIETITTSGTSSLPTQSFSYDPLGNVMSKHGIGTYTYGTCSAGPHAVCTAGTSQYTYDVTGNVTRIVDSATSKTTKASYTPFNLPYMINPTSYSDSVYGTRFFYGADRNRVKQKSYTAQTGAVNTYYLGNGPEGGTVFERSISNLSGLELIQDKHFIYALGSEPIAVIEKHSGRTGERMEYFHRDALGSVVAITDQNGTLAMTMSHDLFGRRRNINLTAANDPSTLPRVFGNEGYTGHEELPDLGLIHMNGRVYDPRIGRFLSADPNIPDPTNTQSYNRYSYVMNNPMNWVDPTGFAGLCAEGFNCLGDDYFIGVPDSLAFTQGSQYAEFRGMEPSGYSHDPMQPEPGLISPIDQLFSFSVAGDVADVVQGAEATYNDLAENGVSTNTAVNLGITVWAALPGKSEKVLEGALDATKGADKVHGHHSFPKALGGHPDQRLSDIIESMHTGKGGIHSDLANFEGGWLRPKKGMTGAQIVEKYGQSDVIEGLRRFYSQDKWSHLSKDFEDAVDFTSKMSK